jgi:hypothetical protein
MIHYDMAMEDYLASPAIGSSTLKNIMLTPADYKAARERKNEDTRATALGTAVHTVILEPDTFYDRYALQPEEWGPKNQGEGRKKWDAFKRENEDKIVITYDDAIFLKRVEESAKNHHMLQKQLKTGRTEATAFMKYSSILDLKARADLLCPNIIWDVKTTSESLDDDSLFKIVFNNGYHFQAVHHTKVLNAQENVDIKEFGWIFVSTKTPAVHIRMAKAPQELLKWARQDHDYALAKLEKCLESNEWSGYPTQIHELAIPDWVRKMYE